MTNFGKNLELLFCAAWAGALWAVGYLAVPVLFQTLADKMLAGILAGKMFTLVSWLGIICASYLLFFRLYTTGSASLRQPVMRIVLAMLLLTLIVQFGIQPMMAELKSQVLPGDVMHSIYADSFRMLHGSASIAYLVQSLLGIALLLKIAKS